MARMRFVMIAVGLSAFSVLGCGSAGSQQERSGAAMRGELPAELSRLIPDDAILSHAEAIDSPTTYRLWIFRDPGGTWLDFPGELPGFERHELPGSVLDGLLAAKRPGLERGDLRDRACRFAHWLGADAEFQVREAVTDRGWFASVEQLPR